MYEVLVVLEKKENEIICQNIKAIDFRWKKYREFESWYYNDIVEYWKYDDDSIPNLLCIRLLFNKKIIDKINEKLKPLEILELIKPKFDWEENDKLNIKEELEFLIKKTENIKYKNILKEALENIIYKKK